MDHRDVARLLSQEHPQTIAVALFRLNDTDAGEILKLFPESLQVDVISRIARIDKLPPDVVAEVDALLSAILRPRI